MLKKNDDILINFEIFKGKNPENIVFLHGFLGNLSSFDYFSKVFNNFGYTTINIDLTNFGFQNLNKNFTIYDYADVIHNLLLSLKIKNPIIVSHSFGGRIAIILASMYNYNNKLILVDSAGIKPKFNLKTKFKILRYKINKKLVKFKIKNERSLKKFGSSDYQKLNSNLKQVFINVVNEDLTYLLSNIKCKTLIIFGKFDEDTPLYMAKKIAKKH